MGHLPFLIRFGMYMGKTIASFTSFACVSVVVVVVVVVVGTPSAGAISLPITVEAAASVSGRARLSEETGV